MQSSLAESKDTSEPSSTKTCSQDQVEDYLQYRNQLANSASKYVSQGTNASRRQALGVLSCLLVRLFLFVVSSDAKTAKLQFNSALDPVEIRGRSHRSLLSTGCAYRTLLTLTGIPSRGFAVPRRIGYASSPSRSCFRVLQPSSLA